jgi:hypothetical protein
LPFANLEKLLPNADQQRALVQFGTHVGRNMQAMKFRQPAPVHRWAQMVRGVEAVVQEQPVDESPGDVPRMIKSRIVIAILVLEQIDRDDSPLGKQPWHAKINQGGPPVQKQQANKKHQNHEPFPVDATI